MSATNQSLPAVPAPKQVCFVICPIGQPDSEERQRSDVVLKHVFRKALEPLGYCVIRADEISQPGSISFQILEKLLTADLVLADLTDHNPNVFYELAVRHAVDKPVIHVIASGEEIPFDVFDLRTVKLDHRDLDSAESARAQIKAQVEEIRAGRVGKTPLKLAAIVQRLGANESARDVLLQQVLETLQQLRAEVRELAGGPVRSGLYQRLGHILGNRQGAAVPDLSSSLGAPTSSFRASQLFETRRPSGSPAGVARARAADADSEAQARPPWVNDETPE